MKINPISGINFNGLYKLDRTYIGNNTEQFICDMWSNNDVITSHAAWSDDVFVLMPDSKDKEFEECVKKDNGKYWKSKPLSDLMMYSNLLKEIFRINYYSNDHKENWTDYTENWQLLPKDAEDDLPF